MLLTFIYLAFLPSEQLSAALGRMVTFGALRGVLYK